VTIVNATIIMRIGIVASSHLYPDQAPDDEVPEKDAGHAIGDQVVACVVSSSGAK